MPFPPQLPADFTTRNVLLKPLEMRRRVEGGSMSFRARRRSVRVSLVGGAREEVEIEESGCGG